MNKAIMWVVVLVAAVIAVRLIVFGIANPEKQGRFLYLHTEPSWYIVVDKETGVEYFTNRYIFTPLVDKSGNPLIWEGAEE